MTGSGRSRRSPEKIQPKALRHRIVLQKHGSIGVVAEAISVQQLHRGPGDYGMVFIPGGYRRTKADTGKIVTALEQKLNAYPGERDLADGEDWL
jgi:hypothetical protein